MIGEAVAEALSQKTDRIEGKEQIVAVMDVIYDARKPEKRCSDDPEKLNDVSADHVEQRRQRDPDIAKHHCQNNVYRELEPIYRWRYSHAKSRQDKSGDHREIDVESC